MTAARRRRGFTLLELLIAMVIGLTVSATAVQIYLAHKQTSRVAEGLARLQENTRFALYFFRQGVQRGGLPGYSGRAALVSSYSGDGGGLDSDRLGVWFTGRKDCLGSTTAVDGDIQNQYLIRQDGDGVPSLYCGSSLNVDGSGQPLTEPIIRGADHMQVLYGVDSDGDARRSADRYLSFDRLQTEAGAAPDVWADVVSIRVALLLNTVEPIKPATETKTYRLLDGPALSFTDRLGRQLVTTTVPLRNRF